MPHSQDKSIIKVHPRPAHESSRGHSPSTRTFLGKVCLLYEESHKRGECGGVFCGQKTGLDIRTPPSRDVRSHQTPPRSPSRGDGTNSEGRRRGEAAARSTFFTSLLTPHSHTLAPTSLFRAARRTAWAGPLAVGIFCHSVLLDPPSRRLCEPATRDSLTSRRPCSHRCCSSTSECLILRGLPPLGVTVSPHDGWPSLRRVGNYEQSRSVTVRAPRARTRPAPLSCQR